MNDPRSLFSLNRIALLLCALLVFATGINAAQVRNGELQFSLLMPENFEPSARLAAADPDYVLAYWNKRTDGGPTLIVVERLHVRVGYRRLASQNVHPDAKLTSTAWRGLEIDGWEYQEVVQGLKVLNLNVIFPLAPEAVQLNVSGPADQEPSLRALQAKLIESFNGSPDRPALLDPSLDRSLGYRLAVNLGALAALAAGLFTFWKWRRWFAYGFPFMIPIAIFALGLATPAVAAHELAALKSVLVLVGLCGYVFALIGRRKQSRAA